MIFEDKFIQHQLYYTLQKFSAFNPWICAHPKNTSRKWNAYFILQQSTVFINVAIIPSSWIEFGKWYLFFTAQKAVNWILLWVTVLFSGFKLPCMPKKKKNLKLSCWIHNYFIWKVEKTRGVNDDFRCL